MRTDFVEPIKKFRYADRLSHDFCKLIIAHSGHTDEINQLKCNPSRTRLASCSDDKTTRIWKVDKIENDSEETIPGLAASDQTVVLTGHTHSVNMIGWMPIREPGTNEIIATSSFDDTVRVWDAVTGKCIKILTDHKRPVYTLAFSPDGKWLATGGGDGWLFIYWVKVCAVAVLLHHADAENRRGRRNGHGMRDTTNPASSKLRGRWFRA